MEEIGMTPSKRKASTVKHEIKMNLAAMTEEMRQALEAGEAVNEMTRACRQMEADARAGRHCQKRATVPLPESVTKAMEHGRGIHAQFTPAKATTGGDGRQLVNSNDGGERLMVGPSIGWNHSAE